MSQNKIKIISKQNPKSLLFFFMGEKGRWKSVSSTSDLSRAKFKDADIINAGEDIISTIYNNYNTGNQGVQILFVGPENEYSHLQQCVSKHYDGKSIECSRIRPKIVVAGKVRSGKSTFVEEMCKQYGGCTEHIAFDGYEQYISGSSSTTWYEIAGIDIGNENVVAAQETFDRISDEGITDFIYCISTSKVEQLEERFIAHVRDSNRHINVLLLLTNYLEEWSNLHIEQWSKQLRGVTIIPILAKSRNTKRGLIEAYGLDDVNKCLFEGK